MEYECDSFPFNNFSTALVFQTYLKTKDTKTVLDNPSKQSTFGKGKQLRTVPGATVKCFLPRQWRSRVF